MKHVHFLFLPLLLCALSVGAQSNGDPRSVVQAKVPDFQPAKHDVAARYNSVSPIINTMMPNNLIWYSDFETATDWTFQNQAGYGWSIVDDGQQTGWFLTNLNSTSGGKRAEMDNGDPSATPPTTGAREHIMVTTNPIDVSTISDKCILQYEQRTWRFRDEYHIEVSNNGNTWTEIGNNDHLLTSTDFNSTTGSASNPEYVAYYIPETIVGTGNDNLWLRFRWNDLDDDGTSYGWVIDDVSIFEGPDLDLDLARSYYLGETDSAAYIKYTQIPTHQGTNANFRPAGLVINQGSQSQSNILVIANDLTTNYVSTSNTFSLNPGEMAIEEVNDLYQPSALGNHSLQIASSEVMELIEVNAFEQWDFEITENTWAYDDGEAQSAAWYGNAGYTMCAYFDNFTTDTIRALRVYFPLVEGLTADVGFTSGSSVGALIYSGDGSTMLGSNAFYTVNDGAAGTIIDDWVTIPLEVPLTAAETGFNACFRVYADETPVGVEWDVPTGLALVDPDGGDDWSIPITSGGPDYNVLPMIRVVTTDSTACDGVDITITGTVTDIFEAGSFVHSIDITIAGNGTAPLTAVWSGPGSFTVIDGEDVEGIDVTGIYTVVVTDINGCKGSASFDIEPNGFKDPTSKQGFALYPNPANGNTTLELFETGIYSVELLSAEGTVLYAQQVNADNTPQINLPIAELAAGMYFVRVHDGSSESVQRLVIR